ncbi:MAG: Phasin [Hyphomicrobiales bacterium]|nr:MAG: Phasin [Hyphomicrobiales bacterium]
MFAGFEDMQKFSKDNAETAMKSFGTVSKGFQAIAAEVADYTKKSFEDSAAVANKVMTAKSLDTVLEAQSEYAKSSYEGMVGQMSKIGEMYADVAKDFYKPFEDAFAKAAK